MGRILVNIKESYWEFLSQKQFWIWLAVFLFFRIIDYTLTAWAVGLVGPEGELNPVGRWFMSNWGPNLGTALFGIVTVPVVGSIILYILGLFSRKYVDFKRGAWIILWMVNAICFGVVVWWIIIVLRVL